MMLKKRLIFTLLHDAGSFVLSRNFRLQIVGGQDWLEKNYNFSRVAFFIDELIILDVTRETRDIDAFAESVRNISSSCFVPIAAGGGVRTLDDAHKLLRSGADKIVVNSLIFENPNEVEKLAKDFGSQCLVASIDVYKNQQNKQELRINNGTLNVPGEIHTQILALLSMPFGEIYLNSINRDGTGQGFDFDTVKLFHDSKKPIILAGGAGHGGHLLEALSSPYVDAVATANLFNFIGDGLEQARKLISSNRVPLASWPYSDKVIADLRK